MIYKQEDSWSTPKFLDIGSDMSGDFFPVSISFDGKELYLVYKDILISDLYVSNNDGNSWSKPESLGNIINSRYYETHASISSDSKSLYFTSNRKGGWGGMDIYRSARSEDGAWMEPVNLGFGIKLSRVAE